MGMGININYKHIIRSISLSSTTVTTQSFPNQANLLVELFLGSSFQTSWKALLMNVLILGRWVLGTFRFSFFIFYFFSSLVWYLRLVAEKGGKQISGS